VAWLPAAAGAAALAGIALSAWPSPALEAAWDPGALRVLTFNIHQGLDVRSVPSLPEIARVVEQAAPDLVALQEVNRGMTVSGGVDAVAWLRWRFPAYALHFEPMHGTLMGNAVMSRHPFVESGGARFEAGLRRLPRGYAFARVDAPGGELLFASLHLTPYDRSPDDAREREAQARELVGFWNGRARTVLAGDWNADPGSAPIRRAEEAGLVDAQAAVGRRADWTSPHSRRRIDYVFSTADLRPLEGEVLTSEASDHRPVRVSFEGGR
jgi:endonuclease/exonuclease/phosphatase family metal-dependent hydrolase